ncbi:MAG: PhzF family phenazine biosynthesis protein, partial [Pseudomonadota bacterium]
MRIPVYQVDAFASRLFTGNPAAVCPLEQWLPDETLQSIAAENNLSETAFFVPDGDRYRLRWFTPKVEVDLCGHATLASAFVILNRLEPSRDRVSFVTQSAQGAASPASCAPPRSVVRETPDPGELIVRRAGDLLALDFPARPPEPCEIHAGLIAGLGARPQAVLAARDYLVVYESEEQVRTLAPRMELLSGVDRFAVIVTAPGHDADFVSRFFAPAKGIPEDPVTGSAHCTLIPYWAKRLG